MKIKRLKIFNFRSFGPMETEIDLNDLTAIIGANSSGKTSTLHALQKLFGGTRKERDITRSDFHIKKNETPEDISKNRFYIEAVIDFPELEDDFSDCRNSIPPVFERMVVDGHEKTPYARIRLDAKWERGNTPEGEIETDLFFITVPEGDENEDEEKNRITISGPQRANIQMIYIPAIREPYAQLRNVSGTLLWRILNGINWSDDFKQKIKEKAVAIENLFENQGGVKNIQRIIRKQWKSFHKDKRYINSKVKFSASDIESILNKVDIEFSPTEITRAYKVDSLGEGLRSLFYFSLVSSLIELEMIAERDSHKEEAERMFRFAPPALTIMAVEEPENHISPHLLGKVIQNIIDISRKSNAQVLITSHTPAIIKRIEPESIRHLRICKTELNTKVNKIILPSKEDEAYKYVKEAVTAYPEIYFSRFVVLGEGDTESIVIPKAVETLAPSLDACGVTVVPLGGRYVNHFWKLLKQLEIPFLTLLDLDSERSGGGWGRVKYVIEQLIKLGVGKSELLHLDNDNFLDNDDFIKMHTWDLNTLKTRENLMSWVNYLESHGVFFSSPLDIDFSMLGAFENQYKTVAPDCGGPIIPDKEEFPELYHEKLAEVIKNTLKNSEGKGCSYTQNEKELMLWYPYLFLNRGKPSTHILTLSKIDDKVFKKNMPEVIRKLVNAIMQFLKDDPFSILYEDN